MLSASYQAYSSVVVLPFFLPDPLAIAINEIDKFQSAKRTGPLTGILDTISEFSNIYLRSIISSQLVSRSNLFSEVVINLLPAIMMFHLANPNSVVFSQPPQCQDPEGNVAIAMDQAVRDEAVSRVAAVAQLQVRAPAITAMVLVSTMLLS